MAQVVESMVGGFDKIDSEGSPEWGSEAWMVVQVFRWIGQEGRSTFWAADELNRLGIKPRYAEKWSPALIGFICKNRAYTGKHAYNKACYITNPERPLKDITAEVKRTIRRPKPEDDWAHFEVPALVSEELWRRALESIRDTNLDNATFTEKQNIISKLGVKVYPSDDGKVVRIVSRLNPSSEFRISPQIISIASVMLSL